MDLHHRLVRLTTPLEKPAKGFFTTEQWAKKWGISEVHARRLLCQGTRATPPLIEIRRYRIQVGCITYPTPHYAEIKSPKPAKRTK